MTHYLAAYAFSVAGGWLVVNLCLYLMYRSVGRTRAFFKPLDFWVGGAERLVVTTLVLMAPKYVAAFVGGWVALKFAANWQRQSGPDAPQGSLMSLVANVVSFAMAIAAGVFLNPAAINAWQD